MTSTKIIKFEETQDPTKSLVVNKLIEVDVDLGTLLTSDTNDLNKKKLISDPNEYFKELARENAQILINRIWELPSERYEDHVIVKLPKPTYVLPRQKPVPKPKEPTKWELYAREKGIKPKKKSKLVWDEILKKWVPRFGYKKAAAEKEKNWVIEVPSNVDPYTDMFETKANLKSEKVSKNEFQRLRNVAKAKNVKVPSMGLPPVGKMDSVQLNSAANIAHVSTASLGKFQRKSPKEKVLTKESILPTKKRKLPPPTLAEEQLRNVKIADSILNKKPKLDLNKAVQREIHTQEVEASESKKQKGGGRGKGRGGGGNAGKKPKAGKGKRVFKGGKTPKGGGRKRR